MSLVLTPPLPPDGVMSMRDVKPLKPKVLAALINEEINSVSSKASGTGNPKHSRSSTPTGNGRTIALTSSPLSDEENESQFSTSKKEMSISRGKNTPPYTDSPGTQSRKVMQLFSLSVSAKQDSDPPAESDGRSVTSTKLKSPKRMFGKGLAVRNSITQGSQLPELDAETAGATRLSHLAPACSKFRVDVGSLPLKSSSSISEASVKIDVSFVDCTSIEHICDGCNSNLFKAEFDGKPVIVKRLKIERINMPHVLSEFEFESEFLRRSLQSPKLVRIYASGMDQVSEFDLPEDVKFDPKSQLSIVTDEGDRKVLVPFVIMERLTGGTLSYFLSKPRSYHSRPYSLLKTFNIWKQLAEALVFLHDDFDANCSVIHRDLKPDNICFDANDQLRLIDFGLSICVKKTQCVDEAYAMTGCTGSLRYMAPEVASNKPYNDRADIYSFGIIAYELLTGVAPFGTMDRNSFFKRIVEGRERPQLNQDEYARRINAPQMAKELIASCWQHDFTQRPKASEVLRICLELHHEETKAATKRAAACRCS